MILYNAICSVTLRLPKLFMATKKSLWQQQGRGEAISTVSHLQ